MDQKSECLFFSRFRLTDQEGGGSRRELQIADILSSFNFQFISSADNRTKKPGLFRKLAVSGSGSRLWSDGLRDYIDNIYLFSREWAQKLDKKTGLVFIDDPIYFAPLIHAIMRRGIPFVSICHNIESLSLPQVKPTGHHKLFQKELQLLSFSDLILSISREETFLFRNLNLNAYYLPYYPVESIRHRLSRVREKRAHTKKSGILMLGTAYNMATKAGMTAFIRYWESCVHEKTGHPLIVAGIGTEALKGVSHCESIIFSGELSDEKMDDLLTRVSACLCYQESGSGSLTRITEMLIAGIPVLANSHAARSFYNADGVTIFSDLTDVPASLSGIEKWEGHIPVPEKPDTEQLLEKIRLIKKGRAAGNQ